jgi:serine/threonine protein kinase
VPTIGHYEILEKLGEGGMGVVWKARDTRLERFVALKLLPTAKTADPERRRRFVQEARSASALNHPNIVTIYDIDRADGADYIAIEYVAGKTLDQLIPKKGLRLGEALKYAIQIADALAAAHAAGIVHRDLKPGNVMVTERGVVKVLDFGLAKLIEAGLSDSSDLTTDIAPPKTEEGTILGTVAYMSPEQAEAKKVDARSDVFSFGALFYEMLTGRSAFLSDSKMSTLAAVLRSEPEPIESQAEGIPRELARVVQRCLRKDPARRFQHMDDLKVALEDLKEESESGTSGQASIPRAGTSGTWRIAVAAAAVLLAGIAIAGWRLNQKTASLPDEPLQPIPLTSYRGIESYPSFSPDGNQVAFNWNGEEEGVQNIYVKLIGPGGPLRLTNDPDRSYQPKWSPDGRTIAFLREDREEKFSIIAVPALGGPERKLGSYTSVSAGGGYRLASFCWTPDSRALIVSTNQAPGQANSLTLLSLESGETRQLTHPPPQIQGDFHPAISPDGHTLAFARTNGSLYDVWQLKLDERLRPRGEPKQLPAGGLRVASVEWMPDGRQLLLFGDRGNAASAVLYRMPASGSATPQPVPNIGTGSGFPAVSLQGHRLAYSIGTQDTNIWKVGLGARSAALDQGLSSTFRDAFPQYSPDGKRLTFYSNRAGRLDIWVSNVDGSQAARLTALAGPTTGSPRWSPDGQRISFDSDTGGSYQIYTVSPDGGQLRKLTSDGFTNITTNWSRDGRWIYFACKRSGAFQIWKMPAQGGDAVQMTHGGGIAATESPDGRTLYFAKDTASGGLWKMPVEGGPETQVIPEIHRYNYAVTDKGIYFTPDATRDRSASVEFLDFATGTTTTIVKVAKPLDLGITVSPDGRTLLYAQIDSAGRDLMLVENFR